MMVLLLLSYARSKIPYFMHYHSVPRRHAVTATSHSIISHFAKTQVYVIIIVNITIFNASQSQCFDGFCGLLWVVVVAYGGICTYYTRQSVIF